MILRQNHPTVSVVIVNYNGFNYLRRSLSSILQSDYSFYEIIVVDNGSSDGSVQHIRKEFGKHLNRIVILPQLDNRGCSVGNNIGANEARGEYILFLSNDTEVDSSCIKELVNAMERDTSIGAAQAKLLFMNRRDTIDSAGAFLNVVGFGSDGIGFTEKDTGQYDRPYEITYAKGAAMVVRKNVWINLKGFDSLFFCYFEEADFCWRVWLSGYRVVFVPSAKVFHVGGATTSKFGRNTPFRRNIQFQDYRNRIVSVVKNLELKNLIKYAPWLFAINLYYALLYVRRNDSDSVLGNLCGITWCLRFFRSVWTKRLMAQRVRVVSDEDLFKRGVISRSVWFLHNQSRRAIQVMPN